MQRPALECHKRVHAWHIQTRPEMVPAQEVEVLAVEAEVTVAMDQQG